MRWLFRYSRKGNNGAEGGRDMNIKRTKANSTRMGNLLIGRLASGRLIDRKDMKRRKTTKTVSYTPVPNALKRFFKPIGGCDAKDC